MRIGGFRNTFRLDCHGKSTVKFMENMYTFFKIHDVSDRTQYIKQLDLKSAPYMNINDERLK